MIQSILTSPGKLRNVYLSVSCAETTTTSQDLTGSLGPLYKSYSPCGPVLVSDWTGLALFLCVRTINNTTQRTASLGPVVRSQNLKLNPRLPVLVQNLKLNTSNHSHTLQYIEQ
jgi:hypothetical protein